MSKGPFDSNTDLLHAAASAPEAQLPILAMLLYGQ